MEEASQAGKTKLETPAQQEDQKLLNLHKLYEDKYRSELKMLYTDLKIKEHTREKIL